MNEDHKAQQLEADNKAAQIHAEHVKAAVIDAALRVRDVAAPVVTRAGVTAAAACIATGAVGLAVAKVGAHQAKRAGVYAGAFIRTLVGR